MACAVDGCDRQHRARGYCGMHYNRLVRGRPIGGPERESRGPRAENVLPPRQYVDESGYINIQYLNQRWKEHRLVMESFLGRRLAAHEDVHHINGDRADNRLENLELWSSRQPRGQRVQDKVEYALEILRLYAPEALSTGSDSVV